MTQTSELAAPVLVGDYVVVPATPEDVREGYAYLVRVPGLPELLAVRVSDVNEARTGIRGQVGKIDGDQVAIILYSPTDEYSIVVPRSLITVLPHKERLEAGHLYRPAGAYGPEWLYDGEAFYPVESFPQGAVDRDQLPPRLTDLGHLRDL